MWGGIRRPVWAIRFFGKLTLGARHRRYGRTISVGVEFGMSKNIKSTEWPRRDVAEMGARYLFSPHQLSGAFGIKKAPGKHPIRTKLMRFRTLHVFGTAKMRSMFPGATSRPEEPPSRAKFSHSPSARWVLWDLKVGFPASRRGAFVSYCILVGNLVPQLGHSIFREIKFRRMAKTLCAF